MSMTMEMLEKRIAKAGGDDRVFERIRGGEGPRDIMRDFGIARTWFYNWLDERPGRRERYADARRDSAPALIERGRDTLDDLADRGGYESAEVTLTGMRARYYQNMAEMYDPDRFGRGRGAGNVTVNIGQLHLDALRQLGGAPAPPAQLAPVEILSTEDLHEE